MRCDGRHACLLIAHPTFSKRTPNWKGKQVPASGTHRPPDIFSQIFSDLSRDIKSQAGLRYLFRDAPENMIAEVAIVAIHRSATGSIK
jgi:hypothetical protein